MSPGSDQQIRSAVHNYFREFGYELSETIYAELLKQGGMQRLLRRMGITDPGYPDDQYAAVLNYLRQNGEEKFLAAIGQGKVEYRPTIETDRNRMRELEEKQKEMLKRKFIRESHDHEPQEFRSPAPKGVTPAPAEEEEPAAAPTPVAVEVAPQTPAEAPAAPGPRPGTRPDGTWDGVTERRTGQDRRSGQDRRERVEVIFKNRRFGGDRRADKERRKNWPPSNWPPSDTRPASDE
ncbi:hypothetical protein KQI84_18840 [bacterium]|nr:hypothetical protein [bacterium]